MPRNMLLLLSLSEKVNLIGPINTHLRPVSLVPRHHHLVSLSLAASLSAESIMATNSLRVAAAQMTSINDLAANFTTCSRLVKEAASAGAKLLCFPEAFSYVGAKDGDSVSIAEPLDGPIMGQYCSLARCKAMRSLFLLTDPISQEIVRYILDKIDVTLLKEFREFVLISHFVHNIGKYVFNHVTELHLLMHCRESSIWLSLGGFQEKGSDDEHLCNTHVIVDDTGKIRSSYRKIHL